MTVGQKVDFLEGHLLRNFANRLPDALRELAERAQSANDQEAKEAVVMLTARLHASERISGATAARTLVVLGVTLDDKTDSKSREQWVRGMNASRSATVG